MHHARAGHADVYHTVRLRNAVECARHEGVILHRVAEHDELCAAESAAIRRQARGLLHRLAHERHRVHVYARLCRAYVHARAHQLRLRQRLRDRTDEPHVRRGHALLHKRGKAADEVHARLRPRRVQCLCKRHVILRLRRPRHQRNRRHRDALVHDGDAEFGLYFLAGPDQVLRRARYLVVYLPARRLGVRVAAVEQGDAHSHRPHVQMLLVYHLDSL